MADSVVLRHDLHRMNAQPAGPTLPSPARPKATSRLALAVKPYATRLTLLAFAMGAVVLSGLSVLVAPLGIDMNVDDAFITLVYARHWKDHGDFFWNVQDGPLDGFTSILDVVVKAIGLWAWPADAVAVTWWSTAGWHAGCAVLGLFLLARVIRPTSRWDWLLLALGSFAATTAVALSESTAFMLEGPLFTFFVLLCLCLFPDKNARAPRFVAFGLSLSLMVFARPEGLALAVAVFALALALRRMPQFKMQESGKMFSISLPIVAAVVGTYLVWHVVKFGYWAPNTYYAKVSESRLSEISDGFQYLLRYGRTWHGRTTLLGLCLVPAFALGNYRPRERFPARLGGLVSALLLVSVAVVVVSGGDGYRCARFFAVTSVLAPVAYSVLAKTGPSRTLRYAAVLLLIALSLSNLVTNLRKWHLTGAPLHRMIPSITHYYCDREVVRRIVAAFPGGRIAQHDYQRTKFFSDATYVLDLSGLNNQQIAHRKVPGRVLWGKYDQGYGVNANPEVWVFGLPKISAEPIAWRSSARVLLEKKTFQSFFGDAFPGGLREDGLKLMSERYTTANVPVCGGYFNFFVRRDLAAQAAAAGLLTYRSASRNSGPNSP